MTNIQIPNKILRGKYLLITLLFALTRGETGLFGTKRRCSKDSQIFRAIGAVDELNSYIGTIVSASEDEHLNEILENVQKDLLTIGSIIAGSSLRFHLSKTKGAEKIIDKIGKDLPRLTNFILPGGTKVASKLQFARSLARRAERRMVRLKVSHKVKPSILTYMNRLSDLIFVLSRHSNQEMGVVEKTWKSGSR